MLDAINEGSLSVTSMTRVSDMLNTTDVGIYRALAAARPPQTCCTVRRIRSAGRTPWLNSNGANRQKNI
jgi:hypothetical protein